MSEELDLSKFAEEVRRLSAPGVHAMLLPSFLVEHADMIADLSDTAEKAEARVAELDAIIENSKAMLHADAKATQFQLPAAIAWCRNEIDMLRDRIAAPHGGQPK